MDLDHTIILFEYQDGKKKFLMEQIKMTEYKTESGDKIEVGKCYRTRDGRKAFVSDIVPKTEWVCSIQGSIVGGYDIASWDDNGIYLENPSESDLISLWEDEVVAKCDRLEVTDEMVNRLLDAATTIPSYGLRGAVFSKSLFKKALVAELNAIRERWEDDPKVSGEKPQVADKLEVTDELFEVARHAYNNARAISCDLRAALQDALQAAFDYIDGKDKQIEEKICSGCKINLNQDVCECELSKEPEKSPDVSVFNINKAPIAGYASNREELKAILLRLNKREPSYEVAAFEEKEEPRKQTLKDFYICRNEISTTDIMHIINEISEYLEQK